MPWLQAELVGIRRQNVKSIRHQSDILSKIKFKSENISLLIIVFFPLSWLNIMTDALIM